MMLETTVVLSLKKSYTFKHLQGLQKQSSFAIVTFNRKSSECYKIFRCTFISRSQFFLNQPSELCLDSQVSDHKFPSKRDAKLQQAILTHEANHRNLEISRLEKTETLVHARDPVSIKLLKRMVVQLFLQEKHFGGNV